MHPGSHPTKKPEKALQVCEKCGKAVSRNIPLFIVVGIIGYIVGIVFYGFPSSILLLIPGALVGLLFDWVFEILGERCSCWRPRPRKNSGS
jgi:hypothetical protein